MITQLCFATCSMQPLLYHPNQHWKVDRLQLLGERNHKKRLHYCWNNASSDYRDTDESFVTVALHSEELHLALALKVREIGDKVKKAFSSDHKFRCRVMGVGVPFPSVSCAFEYNFFTRLLLKEMRRFDPEAGDGTQMDCIC
jgi:hypothetical protein